MIDLVSDTATKPTAGMREAIAQADVGDEQRHEDPTVRLLCERVADMLGAEAALLLPSGIMSNLVSVVVHCRPGDEIVTAANAHVVGSEGAGAAAIGGIQMALIDAPDGRFDAQTLRANVRVNRARAPRPSLIWVENTSNAGGGTCWKLSSLAAISDMAKVHDCRMHLDGARLLNAAIATNTPPAEICRFFDSAWIDLSKGLGCPIGSVLAGSRAFIDEAWVWKHRLGGAMRQAGIIAAAGLYALDHHVDRLAEDHANAQRLANQLQDNSGVKVVGDAVETNIVFVDVSGTAHSAAEIASALETHGVRMGVSGSSKLRAVTHLGVSASDIDAAAQAFRRAAASPG